MSKTIISGKIVGANIIDVLFAEVEYLAKEKGMDIEETKKIIMDCPTFDDVNKILQEKFNGEIKIIE
jgi:hypothetical protein